jgi:hypothetical protein
MNDETIAGKPARYWHGAVEAACQLSGREITNEFVDGRVPGAGWAIVHPAYFRQVGGRLGTGAGQRYRKQADGRWLKVEG